MRGRLIEEMGVPFNSYRLSLLNKNQLFTLWYYCFVHKWQYIKE